MPQIRTSIVMSKSTRLPLRRGGYRGENQPVLITILIVESTYIYSSGLYQTPTFPITLHVGQRTTVFWITFFLSFSYI